MERKRKREQEEEEGERERERDGWMAIERGGKKRAGACVTPIGRCQH